MAEYPDRGTSFWDMSVRRKTVWTLKLITALLTFGFAFPNVMHD
jgi:hypothetical protein